MLIEVRVMWLLDLHVVPVSDGTDTEEEESRGHQLVSQSPQESEMVTRVGSEYCRRVRGHSVAATVVLIEHDGVPVHQEHDGRAQEGPEVLGHQVEGNFPITKWSLVGRLVFSEIFSRLASMGTSRGWRGPQSRRG